MVCLCGIKYFSYHGMISFVAAWSSAGLKIWGCGKGIFFSHQSLNQSGNYSYLR